MQITLIEIYQSPIKLKEPFIISLGTLEYAENIVVVIRTDEGLTGFGECSPFMTINGESMETCFVVGQYLAKILKGKDPLNIEACSAAMDKVIYANTSIKSAFDIALHDIAAQHVGQPLYAFLGGSKNKTLITDYTVSIGAPTKMAADALKIKQAGFTIIKVKLGGTKEEDIERIRLIRETVGNDIALRTDANQGWDVTTAIEILKAISVYNIQHCEEPIPRWNFMQLAEVSRYSPIPIMADECCGDHNDAQRLIDLQACGLFNLKLGKSSGIFKVRKIIALAEQAGINMQMGAFLESRLGMTAAAHVALSSNNILHYDFDTPMMFVEDPIKGGISYGANGEVIMPDAPGLGAWLDEGYLKGLKSVVVG